MEIENRITRKSNLEINDSLSAFDNYPAQQTHNVYEIFYKFLLDVKPKRIIEIGTAMGGFTMFLKKISIETNLNFDVITYDINENYNYQALIDAGIELNIQNVFDENYSTVSESVLNLIKSEGTTIVLCDGGHKISEFNLLSKYIKPGDFILAHDYSKTIDEFKSEIFKKVWNWCEITYDDIENSINSNDLYEYNPSIFKNAAWGCFKKNNINMNNITLVTGIWNIGRGTLTEGWARPFEHYLKKFEELLKIDCNLIIFGDEEVQEFVFKFRNESNTQFINRNLSWFKENEYFDLIQKIRNNPDWRNQTGWLSESTQSKLELYNPLVMSKMFLLHDAKILDKFNSENLFWIDGGITNTVHPGYFTHDKVLNKLSKYINKFSFICFPYETETEIHGFEINKLNDIANDKVSKVARGGFFGGPKNTITDINNIYYGLLKSTLFEGYMGTEESIFSIMCYKHSDLINYFEIEQNGLLGKFFEDLKNDNLVIKSENKNQTFNSLDPNKVGLYVIGFNSPKQFKTLITSFIEYDKNFLDKPKKFLIDNSTDTETFSQYKLICEEFGFEHIKHDNLGICGGRQWIAEHFENTDLDYYFFFEDDMFFFPTPGKTCRNGFNRFVPNLFDNCVQIIKKDDLDFLKLNFSEFYGDNSTQWSWYNVPQPVREEFWPEKPNLPKAGLDPNAPKTKVNGIYSHNGIPYIKGEIYYCNWPQIVSRTGNKKMFLETKWVRPFEQTWMSHIYQLTKKGEINPGLLLLTPTEHNRFEHYDRELRKES